MLEISAVGTAESALVNDGSSLPPTIHMLSSLAQAPYVGYVITRPFAPGHDASAAIAGLGVLPATMRAQELVVTWEHADLVTAIGLGGEPLPTAVAVLVASHDSHEVRWHPFEASIGPPAPSGRSTLVPRWGSAWREADCELPEPIARLLSTWRAGWDPRELRWVHAQLERDGYTVHWMKRARSLRATSTAQ